MWAFLKNAHRIDPSGLLNSHHILLVLRSPNRRLVYPLEFNQHRKHDFASRTRMNRGQRKTSAKETASTEVRKAPHPGPKIIPQVVVGGVSRMREMRQSAYPGSNHPTLYQHVCHKVERFLNKRPLLQEPLMFICYTNHTKVEYYAMTWPE